MKQGLSIVLSFCLFFAVIGVSSATDYVENFDAPFPEWKTGWLGSGSNLQNYYVDYENADPSFRGTNPEGLWISDGDVSNSDAIIWFNPDFGLTLTSFSIDIIAYGESASLIVYDTEYNIILNTPITPGEYSNFRTTSNNGISGFTITGTQVEGNTGIDNVVVTSASQEQIPEKLSIDIKPGSPINSVNPQSKGVIPVAVLTNGTLDVDLLDPITFYLGPNEASPVHYAWKDINGDGMVDLILHFRIRDTGIECGDTSTILKGETVDGELIEGSDFISTVNCRRERTFKQHHNRILKHHR